MRYPITLAYVCLLVPFLALAQTKPVGPLPGDEFTGPFASWTNLRTTYGAAGDGQTDDTAALQNALNALGQTLSHSVLYIPKGTYKITSTLVLRQRSNVSVIGELPDSTILQWAGPSGGVILDVNGVFNSRFQRLTFDGGGSTTIGIDQSWDGQGSFFDSHNEYADILFRNLRIGIRAGHLGYGAADSVVSRCRFQNHTLAGLSIENWNALNWFVRDSYFSNNYDGITNTQGAGNFHVFNTLFSKNSHADMEVTNTEYFSIRHNFSTGSGYFFLANPSGSAPCPITFQGNVVLDPTVQAISIGNAGPVMLLDNVVRSSNPTIATVKEGYSYTPVNANLVSVGNTLSSSNPYSVFGKSFTLDDTLTTGGAISPSIPSFPATPTSQGRYVIDVPPGSDATAIQQAINNAAGRSGTRPIVHLPGGIFILYQTLTIPANTDLQLVGDGESSQFAWRGPSGPVMKVNAPSHATLSNFQVVSNYTADGVSIDVIDQAGSTVFLDQADVNTSSQANYLIQSLANANVALNVMYSDDAQTGLKVVGTGLAPSYKSAVGRVDVFGGGDGGNTINYDLSHGGRLNAEDMWYEGGAPGFVNLTDSGVFSLSGARIFNNDPAHGGSGAETPPVILNNFNGIANILNTKIFHGGISIQGQGASTQVLAMGIDGPAATQNFFQYSSPQAQAALLNSGWITSAGGTVAVADQSYNIASQSNFVRSMLSDLRSAGPSPFQDYSTTPQDVRLYRVFVGQSINGIRLQPASGSVAPPPPPPTPAPTVAITAPTAGQSVSGTITLTTSATNTTSVQYVLDGSNYGSAVTSPFSAQLNTTTLANGSHTLSVTATGTGGTTTSSAVNFTVANSSTGTPYVTAFQLGYLRNNSTSWLGYQFTVGSSSMTVRALGRIYVAGNSMKHTLKIVDATSWADIPGASTTLSFPAGTPNAFVYAQLAAPVTLTAGHSYFIVSSETANTDEWYDFAPLTTTKAAVVNGPVFWNGWQYVPLSGYAGSGFVGLSMLYN